MTISWWWRKFIFLLNSRKWVEVPWIHLSWYLCRNWNFVVACGSANLWFEIFEFTFLFSTSAVILYRPSFQSECVTFPWRQSFCKLVSLNILVPVVNAKQKYVMIDIMMYITQYTLCNSFFGCFLEFLRSLVSRILRHPRSCRVVWTESHKFFLLLWLAPD